MVLTSDGLLDELNEAYVALRQSWVGRWRGLPAVVQGGLNWLLQTQDNDEPDGQRALRACLVKAAQAVEAQGEDAAASGSEPPYHNRLHIADTIAGMCCLLRATRCLMGTQRAPLRHEEFLCLLAIVLHDFGHTGRINQFPREIEQRSVEHFTPLVRSMGLDDREMATLRMLVLGTDPAFVAEVHHGLVNLPLPARHLRHEEMAVLVVEADILASALAYPGEDLGRALCSEWQDHYPDRAVKLSTPQGRIAFLESGARFSSRAARALGLHQQALAQTVKLRAEHGGAVAGSDATPPPTDGFKTIA